jgi:hypothetical protein
MRKTTVGQFIRGNRMTGSVMIITVFALMALMGAAALSIDVGQMMMLMSRAQGLADAAALAGAGDTISNHPDEVITRIQQVLAANTVGGGPMARWSPTENIYYRASDTIPNYGKLEYGQEAVGVTVHMDTTYLFGRILGLTDATITRSATALRQFGGNGSGVIFAIDPNKNDTGINLSGTLIRIDGLVHSNTGVDITGNKHQFSDRVEWVNRFRVQGSDTIFDIGDFQSRVEPPPLVLTPAMFGAPDYTINGDYNVSSSQVVPPGTYRVKGSVHVSGSSSQMRGVTFIADGQIQMSGSNHLYQPDRLGVFAYSLSSSSSAINISGAGPNCFGTCYAPTGGLSFSSSDMIITNSSLVAWTICMSGTRYTIRPTPEIGGGKTSARLVR